MKMLNAEKKGEKGGTKFLSHTVSHELVRREENPELFRDLKMDLIFFG